MTGTPFESGARRAIPAVLVYARAQGRLLMIHRNAGGASGRADFHEGKWNGLGGKLEADESPLEGARREFREEAGLDLPEGAFQALGVIQFPNFKPHKNEDWVVFVFSADLDAAGADPARARTACGEGTLHWIAAGELLSLNLWEGDRHFIPHVVERRPFMGTIWYREGRAERAWIEPL